MDSSGTLPEAPPGWSVSLEKGRLIYQTCPPVVKIHSVAVLKEYQKKGRYLTVDPEELVFSKKKLKIQHQKRDEEKMDIAVCSEHDQDILEEGHRLGFDDSGDISILEDTASGKRTLENMNDGMKFGENSKLEKEREKVRLAVENLTIDTSKKVDHREALAQAAHKLSIVRVSNKQDTIDNIELSSLKSKICEAKNEDEIARILWNIPAFKTKFSTLINSKYLEQLLNLSQVSTSPLLKFPPDINSNLYSDIIEFALEYAPDFLLLIVNLAIKHENPLDEKDVIKVAYLFAQFASSVSSKNSTMKKIKSISLKSSGLTNEGLDCLAAVGVVETSRTFRNGRDFLAGISDEILKSYARTMMAQFTFDNLDIQINHIMHHLTLNYLEFEQTTTFHLSTDDSLSFDQMKSLFSLDTVIMLSDQNSQLFDHYKVVVATTLGRFFGEEIPEVRWLLSVFKKHYEHPNSDTARKRSLIHVDKPMYLQETKNR